MTVAAVSCIDDSCLGGQKALGCVRWAMHQTAWLCDLLVSSPCALRALR